MIALGQTAPESDPVPWTAWAIVLGAAAGMFALAVTMKPSGRLRRNPYDDMTGVFPYLPPGNDNVGLLPEMMADEEEYDEDWQVVPPKSQRRPTPPFRTLDPDLIRNGRRRRSRGWVR